MAEEPKGCARITGAVEGEKPTVAPQTDTSQPQKAPDFQAPVYYQGKFGNVKQSDFLG